VVLYQLMPTNSVIIDDNKKEMAAAKQYLRQSMVVSLTDKPPTSEAKNTEDKDTFVPVCVNIGYNNNTAWRVIETCDQL